MLCPSNHIIFILKQQVKKKKGHVSSLFIQLFIEEPQKLFFIAVLATIQAVKPMETLAEVQPMIPPPVIRAFL